MLLSWLTFETMFQPNLLLFVFAQLFPLSNISASTRLQTASPPQSPSASSTNSAGGGGSRNDHAVAIQIYSSHMSEWLKQKIREVATLAVCAPLVESDLQMAEFIRVRVEDICGNRGGGRRGNRDGGGEKWNCVCSRDHTFACSLWPLGGAQRKFISFSVDCFYVVLFSAGKNKRERKSTSCCCWWW